MYRSLENYPEGETYPGLLILRFDGTLFYANTPDFISAVRQAVAAADPPAKVVLIDGESMNDIDATAVIVLKEFQAELARAGTEMRLTRMKTSVMNVIQRSPLYDAIPSEYYYLTVQDAVDAFLTEYGNQE
jgi:MFS superfamily sulfate permease-like transporter